MDYHHQIQFSALARTNKIRLSRVNIYIVDSHYCNNLEEERKKDIKKERVFVWFNVF